MNKLGAFYTRDDISNLLVGRLSSTSPETVVDLGIGNGSLTTAADERWKDASFYASDINVDVERYIRQNLPFVNFTLLNGMNRSLPSKLLVDQGLVDVAICNPPYLKLKKKKVHNQLFEEANLKECQKLSVITTDLLFLAQNLRLLRKGGEMGIILPDGLIANHTYKRFREALLQNHNLKGVITLPEKVFQKTEAKTHILIIEKGINCQEYIPILRSDRNGNLSEEIVVESSKLVNRMDYEHFKWEKGNQHSSGFVKLSTLVHSISRGKQSFKELRSSELNYLHSTNLNKKQSLDSSGKTLFKSTHKVVQKGDIALVRVGRNSIGDFVLIEKGNYAISDCLFKIEPREEFRDKIVKSLSSDYGKSWLKGFSHGVCAKVISKNDLLNFPVKL